MIRFFTQRGTSMLDISDLHPAYLEALIELSWNQRVKDPTKKLGDPENRSAIDGRPAQTFNGLLTVPQPRIGRPGTIDVPTLANDILTFTPPAIPAAPPPLPGIRWPHLIYAYMIENTRVVEVFRRVLTTFLYGEKLSVLSPASQRWAWTTEELFFSDAPSQSIMTQTSGLRKDIRIVRGSLFYRLLGMPLNTMNDADKISFPTNEQANLDFVNTFDELLHEIWQGRTNFANQVGARPTDDAKITQLAVRIADMMQTRRSQGTLSREEYWAVTTMSWFHATLLQADHPILTDLRVTGSSPEERLFNIAQRVGYPAHGLSKSYFEIAEPISRLLTAIETGTYNDPAAAPALYTPPAVAPPPGTITPVEDTDRIKTHWSIIRGRDIKATKIAK